MSVNKELKDYLKNSGEHSTIGQTLFPAKKRHKHDMKNIGLLKQNGKYYSIHDLPDGFVVRGDLDLSGMDLSDVNLNMEVMGTLILSGEYKTILPPILDLSNMAYVDLHNTDLSGVREIKWPTDSIHLIACKKLPPVLDFRGTKNVKARNADLSGVSEIKRSVDLPGNLRKIYDLLWVKMFMAAKSKNTFKGIIQRNVANRHISKKR